jgi:hypothetical protein
VVSGGMGLSPSCNGIHVDCGCGCGCH